MEWMLQVVDELDDALGVLRHGCLGLMAEIGEPMLAVATLVAAVAGHRLGADPASIATAAVAANLATLLKIRNSRIAARCGSHGLPPLARGIFKSTADGSSKIL
jgi:hypothetical protein